MTRFFAGLTVLLIHTGAAWAQQFPSAADTGALAEGPPAPAPKGSAAPPPPAPETPPPPAQAAPAEAPAQTPPAQPAPPQPEAAPQPVPQPDSGYPPGYGPPPGYVPPPGFGPRPRPAAPPVHYGAPAPYYIMPPPPPPRRVTDRPFTLGASAGFGGLKLDRGNQEASETGFAYSARLGFGLRPGLLLMWDLERSVVDRGSSTYAQTANLLALQLFIGDRLFLRGGLGLAQADQDSLRYTDWGFAVMGGIGIELVQGWNWSMDLSSTVTAATYKAATVDETWINWSAVALGLNFF